jgi:hypothetical protein
MIQITTYQRMKRSIFLGVVLILAWAANAGAQPQWQQQQIVSKAERSPKPRTNKNWLDAVRPGQFQAVNRIR